jgi:predicted RNA-binding Zn-ribbon protein involved in translation (DUF1610 family)
MATSVPASDPLEEYDKLMSEHANLEKQFMDKKVPKEEFEILSKQLQERISRAESQAYKQARKDQDVAKRLRMRSYKDPIVQQVTSHFLMSGSQTLEPTFGPDRLPTYPLRTGKGEPLLLVERLQLQRLADIGILSERLFERIPYCPQCATPSNVYVHFKCPQCGSIDIMISRMVEHLQCGTIHQESAFLVGKNMICPACKKLLQRPDEYRLIGVVCSCNSCQAHFEDPTQGFYCRKCNLDFNLSAAMITDVFVYSMKPEALNEARQYAGVDVLSQVLTENGFSVTVPGIMMGATKEVAFSLIASKESVVVGVDLAQSTSEVAIESVLELYLKTLEASPTIAVLGAIPSLSKRAKDVAALHKIQVAEAATLPEVARKVLDLVNRT